MNTEATYQWSDLFKQVLHYRKQLFKANAVAILAALLSVPIPLLIPLLVDEVLLHKPGASIAFLNNLFPEAWHSPILYISVMTLITVVLRLLWLVCSVYQTREFTLISKDITYHIRQRLLKHLETIAMSQYETLGTGTVNSRLVVDVVTIDGFLGVSIS